MTRNTIYYAVKPFVPVAVRRVIRRRIAMRARERTKDVWPILRGSERPPANWAGWPDNKKFAVVLTHDVESPLGLDQCQRLMDLELAMGFRSSFNFVPEGAYRVSEDLRNQLVRNGFEVGVHDLKHDGRLYKSRRDFENNAVQINHYLQKWGAVGFRSAFMLRKLAWLHDLNIKYDASTFDTDPFEPQPEGCHTIFPFWVSRAPNLDLAKPNGAAPNNSSDDGYVELPYTLPQDYTLFLLLREKSPDIWFRKLDWIAENGGMALVITHPDYMTLTAASQKAGGYPIEFYGKFLEYIRDKYSGDYWHALPKQIASHTLQSKLRPSDALGRAPSNQPLSDNRWRLRGAGAAVLLFSYYPADPRPRRAAEALAMEGVTIDLLCLQRDQSEPQKEIINGVNVFRVPLKRRRGGKLQYISQYSVFILRSFKHLAFRSLHRRYDFVHVHNMPDVLVFSALIPKLLGAKIVLDLHDPVPELMRTIFELPENSFSVRLLKRLEKWSIRFADLVLTVNLACKKIYCSRSCSPEKINVVLNSPEDDIFRFRPVSLNKPNGEQPARPFVILYHGSLVHRNGFDLAVDALEAARRSIPNAKLMVCGERNAYFEGVMESVVKRGLQDDVEYLGVRDRKQVVEAINACDLGIIPNHRNTFTEINTPTRIFEYLALGKPVIAPRTQGIRDYFSDGDLIFFEAGDANDLARKIEFVFSCPGDVEQIVKRGQQVYLSHRWSQERSNLVNAISGLL